MDQVCLTNVETYTAYVTAAVTFFSVLANFVKADSGIGKVLHWLALNIKVAK